MIQRLASILTFAILAFHYTCTLSAESKPATLTAEELADGWISLFDGETLFGWQAQSKANWAVEDGRITVSEGEQGLLTTTSEFGDYELKVDFLEKGATNSGVFLRTPAVPKNPATDCYELNIAPPDNPFPTGSFVQRQQVGKAPIKAIDWQHLHVTAEGGHFVVKLGGTAVLDYIDKKPIRRGYIGLQFNTSGVAFRNIKLKPLGLKPIFNGKDTAGWSVLPEKKSVFSVTPEGWLNVKDGPGSLETEGKYGDFVAQFECISNGKHLNSGLFFRCLPGQYQNGYESQIQNGYKESDRAQPIDCGTGGFYRRQNARKVLADDFTWFHKTLVVTGPHMAAWVNGIQVSDWTDPRPPHENPRQGLRTAPGTLQIQGHDPTTDLSFRNLRAAEMAEGKNEGNPQ